MKQALLTLGTLTTHRMPTVEIWHKCARGAIAISTKCTTYPYTRKTIKNQTETRVETQHLQKTNTTCHR